MSIIDVKMGMKRNIYRWNLMKQKDEMVWGCVNGGRKCDVHVFSVMNILVVKMKEEKRHADNQKKGETMADVSKVGKVFSLPMANMGEAEVFCAWSDVRDVVPLIHVLVSSRLGWQGNVAPLIHVLISSRLGWWGNVAPLVHVLISSRLEWWGNGDRNFIRYLASGCNVRVWHCEKGRIDIVHVVGLYRIRHTEVRLKQRHRVCGALLSGRSWIRFESTCLSQIEGAKPDLILFRVS